MWITMDVSSVHVHALNIIGQSLYEIANSSTGCVKKKERHFKYIHKIANNQYIILKIKLLPHNYTCGEMSKDEVSILNIH